MAMSDADASVANARALLQDFEDVSIEEQHGAIEHAIAELENARRNLPEEY